MDAAKLLRAEHAVARVLAAAPSEADAYPALLAAIGAELGWDAGAVWLTAEPGTLRCVASWPGDLGAPTRARDDGLPGRVWTEQTPVSDASAVAFPVRGATIVGAFEFFTGTPLAADDGLRPMLTSVGSQIGQFVDRCRAEARWNAVLDAAFDCVITMDHTGHIVEVNEATEEMFGYTAAELVGQELAELMIPPRLREPHRRGVRRYAETGEGRVTGHPVEIEAMRKDGSEFPVELAITRPALPGPPLFCGYIRDITERRAAESELRRLASEQAALRRVATAVASESDPAEVFGLVTREAGRLLGAQTANMIRYHGDGWATVVGGWHAKGVQSVPVGDTVHLDGDTVAARVWRTGRPARVDSYEGIPGAMAERLRSLGFRSAVAAPVTLGAGLWGAITVSSLMPEPFPAGAEQRIADFAELTGQALANAHAHEQLAASRARIVEAGDAERRRLERNLHDGAQQRLVALSLNLRLAAQACDEADEASRAAFERAGDELAQALEELRELARGIHPAVLSDRGLEPALEALAQRTPLPVDIDVGLAERLPEPVEAAAYYVVAEALTNTAKYAQASAVQVRVARANGIARIEVADDGVGGAATGAGSGLRGLCDRVEALGGRLQLDSPVGQGTTLTAEIPAL
jgi:PAS domain S-box-containing protein